MSLNDRLTLLRKRAGFSQRAIAERLSIHYTAISHIEKGDRRPSMDVAERWASTCGGELTALGPEDQELFELLRDLSPADLRLLRGIAEILPRLEVPHRVTLQALIDTWRKSGVSAEVVQVAKRA